MLAMAPNKLAVDDSHPVVMSLRWILKNRRLSGRALSMAAGLSPNHVGQILGGWQKPSIATETATRLAAAGRVSLSWFLTQQGAPDGQDIPALPSDAPPVRFLDRDRRYTEQQMAERVLIADGWPEHDVLRASGAAGFALQSEDQPSAGEWHEKILAVLTAGHHAAKAGLEVPKVGRAPTAEEEEALRPRLGKKRR